MSDTDDTSGRPVSRRFVNRKLAGHALGALAVTSLGTGVVTAGVGAVGLEGANTTGEKAQASGVGVAGLILAGAGGYGADKAYKHINSGQGEAEQGGEHHSHADRVDFSFKPRSGTPGGGLRK